MKTISKKNNVLDIIPHKEPFLFLDSVKECEPGKSLIGVMKNSPSETYYKGHFPSSPITPGVLIVEALAQAACYLFIKSVDPSPGSIFYMCSLKVRFFNQSGPKDIIELYVDTEKMISSGAIFKIKAKHHSSDLLVGELGIICKNSKSSRYEE